MDDGAATTFVQGGAGDGCGAHVLLELELAFHGLLPTLVADVLSTGSTSRSCPFPVAAISDGFDAGGISSCLDVAEYVRRMEAAGSDTLAALLDAEARAGRPVRAWAGRVALPLADGGELRRSGRLAVELGPDDVPPFVAAPQWYPAFTESALSQFDGLELADDVLVNSFRDLEPREADYLESTCRAKTIGPTLPSFYLDDGRLSCNKTYGVDLFSGTDQAPCMAWLDKQEPCSVVLASYGTVANLDAAQLEELGNGLCDSGKPFVWVLRPNEADKLSQQLSGRCKQRGLVVPFCPQLEWADQPTTAKYVESAWGIGVRMRKGLVRREEMERCIREVMEGERKTEFRQNATKRMKKAKEAMQEGGSSDKNIAEFAAKYIYQSSFPLCSRGWWFAAL
ncbi:unnamed protein product [Miscanthus lutarioriparius]|uniref:Uncharacterized protein n=1 Tax=Miscanthus lutarioriparius TaxID=422564 RepID=A0A811MCA9_9POAL|nr:unnamed protein product [Miscanthus lutarioriparius]